MSPETRVKLSDAVLRVDDVYEDFKHISTQIEVHAEIAVRPRINPASNTRCIFRDIRPPIPTTSAHLYRGIRLALTRCREALVFDISFLAFRHLF